MGSSVLKVEIQALEMQGLGKIFQIQKFSLNNRVAIITQGEEIPYSLLSEGSDTSFKEAALLTVTPSIIGDGNII